MRRPIHLMLALVTLALVTLTFGCAKPLSDSQPNNEGISGKPQSSCEAFLKNDGVCLDVIWEHYPTESTFGSLIVFARNLGTGHLVKDFTRDLQTTLWMPSMGHGSSPVKVVVIQPGLFRIEKVFFNMRGDWEVRFQTPTDRAAWALEF